MNDEIFTNLQQRQNNVQRSTKTETSRRHMASLRYLSSSVDLSKLLLVAKVTRLPLDCVASPPLNSNGNGTNGNTVFKDYARK